MVKTTTCKERTMDELQLEEHQNLANAIRDYLAQDLGDEFPDMVVGDVLDAWDITDSLVDGTMVFDGNKIVEVTNEE
jgi:hypothetical protein